MRALILEQTGPLDDCQEPLRIAEIPTPRPESGEVLVRVTACGVCHTELDEIEGRTPPPRLPVVLGHQVVGRVAEVGANVSNLAVGDRIGVGWIYESSGEPDENVSPQFRATGRDVNGGYAEYMIARAAYVYPIPSTFTDTQAAPLLCAGAIGYRALRLTQLIDGEPLGLMGFGSSAHLVLQMVRHRYPVSPVFVFARDGQSREFARRLGASWAGDVTERAPMALRAVIDTTPAWKPIVAALANLQPGGRLVINAIRKEDADKSALQMLSYHEHLWMEREIKSVANITRRDIGEFLPLAAEIPIRPTVEEYRLEEANTALQQLKRGAIRGAKVLVVDPS